MVKNTSSLSQELMLGSALLAGGCHISDVAARIRSWQPVFRLKPRVWAVLQKWQTEVGSLLDEAAVLGAGCGPMLREVSRFVREDERRLAKVQALERQFAFQGAVALVAPWTVLGATGWPGLNLFTVAGASLQAAGLLLFVLLVRRLRAVDRGESAYLRDLVLGVWLRVRCGLSLFAALAKVMERREGEVSLSSQRLSQQWAAWFRILQASLGGTSSNHENSFHGSAGFWHRDFSESPRLASVLEVFLRQGAPASEFLMQYVEYLEDQRKILWEERLASAPTYLSLVFCACFAPAVFAILLGSLWNRYAGLLM